MNLKVKYFGVIKEVTSIDEEIIVMNDSKSVREIKNELIKKYPLIEKHEFRIAIDATIQEDNFKIEQDCIVAILPPFAGG